VSIALAMSALAADYSPWTGLTGQNAIGAAHGQARPCSAAT